MLRRGTEPIPAERLLVFEVAEGWEPLRGFLGRPVPDMPFPRTNSTRQFWESAAEFMPPPVGV